jgi:hypothetical protein
MQEDIQQGVKGVKCLLAAYKDDAAISKRGFDVVDSLEATANEIAAFLVQRRSGVRGGGEQPHWHRWPQQAVGHNQDKVDTTGREQKNDGIAFR